MTISSDEQDWQDAEEHADRIHDLKEELGESLEDEGIIVEKWRVENDLHVTGELTTILNWAQGWRSELEELG